MFTAFSLYDRIDSLPNGFPNQFTVHAWFVFFCKDFFLDLGKDLSQKAFYLVSLYPSSQRFHFFLLQQASK